MSGQGAPDFPGDTHAVTQSNVCVEHPSATDWDDKHLILGRCPTCGQAGAIDGSTAARILRARRASQQTLTLD